MANLVDIAAAVGQAKSNRRVDRLTMSVPPSIVLRHSMYKGPRRAPWTRQEDDFLRQSLGWLSMDEIAQRLNRTAVAVEIRWKRDLHLPAPSKQAGYVNAHQAAMMIGVDGKSVLRLVQRGWLVGRKVPSEKGITLVALKDLKRFLLQPQHWMTFLAKDITDPTLRALVLQRQRAWGDEWMRVGDVARHYGTSHTRINKHIQSGLIPAVRYGNWWIRRSHALDPQYAKRAGRYVSRAWPLKAEAFLVMARALGITYEMLGRMMGKGWRAVASHWQRLKTRSLVQQVIRQANLPVTYRRGRLSVRFEDVAHHFPRWKPPAPEK